MSENTLFYGEISIDLIENIQAEHSENKACKHMEENDVKFVHYPDCQQLIVWLPEYYNKYNTLSILDADSKETIYHNDIAAIVSGSVKIVMDSLFIHPGNFILRIDAIGGLIHEVHFHKLKEGEKLPPKPPEIPAETDSKKGPIVYRDGFGNIIKEGDIDWRSIYY